VILVFVAHLPVSVAQPTTETGPRFVAEHYERVLREGEWKRVPAACSRKATVRYGTGWRV